MRVAGTGRLTLRNRRFLRKFQERSQSMNPPTAAPTSRIDVMPDEQWHASAPMPADELSPELVHPKPFPAVIPEIYAPDNNVDGEIGQPVRDDLQGNVPLPQDSSPASSEPEAYKEIVSALPSSGSRPVKGAISGLPSMQDIQSPTRNLRRTDRVRTIRKFYDASSGQ